MPIQNLKVGPPIIGKIRLGVRNKAKSGAKYPTSVPHFVLVDAPDVARVYGDKPTELDVFFLTDEIDGELHDNVSGCAPHYYKLFAGGTEDKNGNIVGGRLLCQGDGEQALHYEKKDPVTGIVPRRQCLAKECPDWDRGCKQMMNVYVWIPLANPSGVYQIDTSSWRSIGSFVNQLHLMKTAAGQLTKIPFTIYREPEKISYIDQKTKKEKSGTQYIMRIRQNPDFWAKNGEALKNSLLSITQAGDQFFGSSMPREQLDHASSEDHYALNEPEKPKDPIDAMKEIAESEDTAALFEELCKLKKVNNTAKIRLMTTRKFEKEKNPKESLMAYLAAEIEKASPKEEEKPPAKKVEAEVVETPPPQQKEGGAPATQDGLI